MCGALVRMPWSMTMAPLRIDGDPRRVQRQAARVRCSAGSDQQLVGAQFTTRGFEHEFAVRIGDIAGLRMFQYRDPFGTEGGCQGLADGGVFAEEQRAARQDRHLAAQPGEGLRQFQRDNRRTDHGQPIRNRVADQRLGGSPVGCVLQARNRRNRRAGTGTLRCFQNLIRVKGLVACTLTTVGDNAFQSLILSPTVPISDQHFQPVAFND